MTKPHEILLTVSVSGASIVSMDMIEMINNIIAWITPIATATGQSVIFILTVIYLIKQIKKSK